MDDFFLPKSLSTSFAVALVFSSRYVKMIAALMPSPISDALFEN
tara:strand:+ start:264 stop:395 length:132 start_codon:yes stop_codon:yes gene_type:complete